MRTIMPGRFAGCGPRSERDVIWRCRDVTFDLEHGALLMGIVNVTPDSFSDGGRFLDPEAAVDQARRLVGEGAAIVDLGAESTRPGAEPVSAAEQIDRLQPVIDVLARDRTIVISVDTADAEVAAMSLSAGARVVNDVTALGDPRMGPVVAEAEAGLVLMHLRGTPRTMQQETSYDDVAREVRDALAERLETAKRAGIAAECLAIDPGIGFAKTAEQNLELLARLDELGTLGRPVMIGASRKNFLGKVLDRTVERRVEGGAAVAAIGVFHGARIVRTHDVAATLDAVRIAAALHDARRGRSSRQTTRT
jgi:dihydropteroate synthase